MAKNQTAGLDQALSGLNEQQRLQFELLFSQQQANRWLAPVAFTGLGLYALATGILLDPGYSWLVALIPTLFVVLFVDTMLKGVVIETPGQRRKKDQGMVLVALALIMVGMFGLCGLLIRAGEANGAIIAGVGLMMIYPLSLYYSQLLISRKNELLAESLIARIKNGPADAEA